MTQEQYLKDLVNCNKDICDMISSIKTVDYPIVDRVCEIFINSEITNDGEVLIPTVMHLKIAMEMLKGHSSEEKSYATNEHDTMLAYLIYLNQVPDGIMYNKLLHLTIRRTNKQVSDVRLIRSYVNKVISGGLDVFPPYSEIEKDLNICSKEG